MCPNFPLKNHIFSSLSLHAFVVVIPARAKDGHVTQVWSIGLVHVARVKTAQDPVRASDLQSQGFGWDC